MILSYSDLIVFGIFVIGSLLAVLLMETHRANKLVDEVDALMKKLEDLNSKIEYVNANKEDSSNE